MLSFVVSLNLLRRHLDESQRAMVAGRIATLVQGQRADRSIDLSPTQLDAADLLNVSVPSVKRAREVLDHGTPELVASVEQGQIAVSTAAVLTDLPPLEQVEIIARGEQEILAKAKEIRAKRSEVRRDERMDTLAAISQGNVPLLDKDDTRVFPVVYADPPWQYEHVESEARAINNQYPTLSLEEICALPVAQKSTADALLFLWATSPKLSEAMQVVTAWGFTYRTCMVWIKDQIGMGYYARQQHELLLIATRGTPPTPAPEDRPSSVIHAPRGLVHSQKPAAFAEAIERMYPKLPKLELFCRTPRPGWSVWGNQA
jgi:N6-adenosine-specific RNA methylase IME4